MRLDVLQFVEAKESWKYFTCRQLIQMPQQTRSLFMTSTSNLVITAESQVMDEPNRSTHINTWPTITHAPSVDYSTTTKMYADVKSH